MDTQDMALLLIAGILLVALVVVNTTPMPTAVIPTAAKAAPAAPAIPHGAPNMGVTTYVFVYDPTKSVNSVVEVT
jgi:hypothetical protein